MYGFDLYHCYIHIIRSFGARSAISILVREILFCKTENEFEISVPRIIKSFKKMCIIGGSVLKHRDKFISIFGFDENGNDSPRDPTMEPLFIRMAKGIPTCSNHCERFHCYINESIRNLKNRYRKLSILFQCIANKISKIDENVLRKIRQYIKITKKFAQQKIDEDETRKDEFSQKSCTSSDCNDGFYYSQLYSTELPCVHECINEYWSNLDILSLDELKIEETKFIIDYLDTRPIIDYLDDHFKMNDKVENVTNESEFIIESKASTHNAFDNAFSNMINRTYIQLRSTMGPKIKIQEVAGYALSIQTEMLQDEKMIEKYQNDPDD